MFVTHEDDNDDEKGCKFFAGKNYCRVALSGVEKKNEGHVEDNKEENFFKITWAFSVFLFVTFSIFLPHFFFLRRGRVGVGLIYSIFSRITTSRKGCLGEGWEFRAGRAIFRFEREEGRRKEIKNAG